MFFCQFLIWLLFLNWYFCRHLRLLMRAVTLWWPLLSIHWEMPITLLGNLKSCAHKYLIFLSNLNLDFLSLFFADSFLLQRRPWQSSFQRLQELLSIGSRCLGWRLFMRIYMNFMCFCNLLDFGHVEHISPCKSEVNLSCLYNVLSAWSGFGWDLCHFTKLQWSGSSSLRSRKFRTY